jgi:hypothetical protein
MRRPGFQYDEILLLLERHPLLHNAIDHRGRGWFFHQIPMKLSDSLGRPFHFNEDTSGIVSHKAGQVQLPGQSIDIRSEAYSLDQALHQKFRSCAQRFQIITLLFPESATAR